jgi:hypothetical protein
MTLFKKMSASWPGKRREASSSRLKTRPSIDNNPFLEMDARVEPAHDEVIP